MIGIVAKALLRKLLNDPEVKKRLIEALRFEAKKTDTKIDDEAVDIFESIWNVVLPIILGIK